MVWECTYLSTYVVITLHVCVYVAGLAFSSCKLVGDLALSRARSSFSAFGPCTQSKLEEVLWYDLGPMYHIVIESCRPDWYCHPAWGALLLSCGLHTLPPPLTQSTVVCVCITTVMVLLHANWVHWSLVTVTYVVSELYIMKPHPSQRC